MLWLPMDGLLWVVGVVPCSSVVCAGSELSIAFSEASSCMFLLSMESELVKTWGVSWGGAPERSSKSNEGAVLLRFFSRVSRVLRFFLFVGTYVHTYQEEITDLLCVETYTLESLSHNNNCII